MAVSFLRLTFALVLHNYVGGSFSLPLSVRLFLCLEVS
nr:MAG TPA: hypothetical protein [Caudoviricetes sp.]